MFIVWTLESVGMGGLWLRGTIQVRDQLVPVLTNQTCQGPYADACVNRCNYVE